MRRKIRGRSEVESCLGVGVLNKGVMSKSVDEKKVVQKTSRSPPAASMDVFSFYALIWRQEYLASCSLVRIPSALGPTDLPCSICHVHLEQHHSCDDRSEHRPRSGLAFACGAGEAGDDGSNWGGAGWSGRRCW